LKSSNLPFFFPSLGVNHTPIMVQRVREFYEAQFRYKAKADF